MADNNNAANTNNVDNPDNPNTDTGNAGNTPVLKYSEEDMNNITKKNEEKAKKKLLADLGITDVEQAKQILAKANADSQNNAAGDNTGNNAGDSALQSQLDEANMRADNAVLETVLHKNNVKAEKIEKAVKLIDRKDCLDDEGKFSKEKADAAVKELLKDWPELTGANGGDNSNAGFRIGSDGQNQTADGSSQKQTVQKSWNRFNN